MHCGVSAVVRVEQCSWVPAAPAAACTRRRPHRRPAVPRFRLPVLQAQRPCCLRAPASRPPAAAFAAGACAQQPPEAAPAVQPPPPRPPTHLPPLALLQCCLQTCRPVKTDGEGPPMFIWHAMPCQSGVPKCGRGTLATWRVQVAGDDVLQHRLPQRHCHQPRTSVSCTARLQGHASEPVALRQHGLQVKSECGVLSSKTSCFAALPWWQSAASGPHLTLSCHPRSIYTVAAGRSASGVCPAAAGAHIW